MQMNTCDAQNPENRQITDSERDDGLVNVIQMTPTTVWDTKKKTISFDIAE